MLIGFKRWHLEKLRLSDAVRDILGKFPSASYIEALAARGLAYTVVAEAPGGKVRILGVAGAVPTALGVAEVFVVSCADGVRRHRLEFVKSVREVLQAAKKEFATIEALGDGSPPINRWLSWLGFERHRQETHEGREMLLWRMAAE